MGIHKACAWHPSATRAPKEIFCTSQNLRILIPQSRVTNELAVLYDVFIDPPTAQIPCSKELQTMETQRERERVRILRTQQDLADTIMIQPGSENKQTK